MYQKAKLAFSSIPIFGHYFQTSINSAFDLVARMLFANKINLDGSIDMTQNVNLSKKELWSYIYYMFYYNNTELDEFRAMKDEDKGKANALKFYTVVGSIADVNVDKLEAISIDGLIYFINMIVHKYGDNLMNPVFNYLQVMMKKDVMARIMAIHVSTGDTGAMFEVVTNAEKVKNADIKVRLEPMV